MVYTLPVLNAGKHHPRNGGLNAGPFVPPQLCRRLHSDAPTLLPSRRPPESSMLTRISSGSGRSFLRAEASAPSKLRSRDVCERMIQSWDCKDGVQSCSNRGITQFQWPTVDSYSPDKSVNKSVQLSSVRLVGPKTLGHEKPVTLSSSHPHEGRGR